MERPRPRLTIVVKLTAPARLAEEKEAPWLRKQESAEAQHCQLPDQRRHHERGGREERERAASGTIWAVLALTTGKRRESVSGREEALWSNTGLPNASPQCQPSTDRKENNLDRIERHLSICFGGDT